MGGGRRHGVSPTPQHGAMLKRGHGKIQEPLPGLGPRPLPSHARGPDGRFRSRLLHHVTPVCQSHIRGAKRGSRGSGAPQLRHSRTGERRGSVRRRHGVSRHAPTEERRGATDRGVSRPSAERRQRQEGVQDRGLQSGHHRPARRAAQPCRRDNDKVLANARLAHGVEPARP